MRNIFGKMDQDAKDFVAKDEELNQLKIIEILLINSLPLRILTKGYLSFNKPKTETIVMKSTQQLMDTLNDEYDGLEGLDELEDYLKKTIKPDKIS